MPVSVVLVDDHRLIRVGVQAIFEGALECSAVGESENSAEAVQPCASHGLTSF
jgi:DNA-binding NarL/FixJ family response regulator